jgi:hypothetical protein
VQRLRRGVERAAVDDRPQRAELFEVQMLHLQPC